MRVLLLLLLLSGCATIGEPTEQSIKVKSFTFNLLETKHELQSECLKRTRLKCINASGFATKNPPAVYCWGRFMNSCWHEIRHQLEFNGFESNDPHFK